MRLNINKKTIKNSGAAALLAVMGTAYASPVYAQHDEDNFTGFKAGFQAGWEEARINETVLNSLGLNDKNKGVSYGLYGGYDRLFGKVLLGAEVGFSPNGQTLRSNITGGSVELDSKWSADFSARAGVTLTPKFLAYGRVGYGVNRYKVRGFNTGTTAPFTTISATGDGFMYGGGFEYALSSNVSMRAEYRHKDLGGSLKTEQVLGGISYRF